MKKISCMIILVVLACGVTNTAFSATRVVVCEEAYKSK